MRRYTSGGTEATEAETSPGLSRAGSDAVTAAAAEVMAMIPQHRTPPR